MTIMFMPSRSVGFVTVYGPPFAGTLEALCIAARFKSVHMLNFGGAPAMVGKSFSVR